jgi:tRNA threonylcarbamoyladenosine biosynthesis protein TsaE
MLVEWPERLGAMAPKGALYITLTPLDEDRRVAQLTGWEGRL